MTTNTPTNSTDLDPTLLLPILIQAHGDVNLAAEIMERESTRAITPRDIIRALPQISSDDLTSAIKAARTLQAFNVFTIVKDVVLAQLDQLPPERAAKFLIDFADRFEVMLNPPVHGGSGQPANMQQTNFNFGDLEDARAKLASRIIPLTVAGATDSDSQRTIAAGDLLPAVRLGSSSEARPTGTNDSVVDMAASDGPRVGQDADWGADNQAQS